jgi:glycine cleavage system regulatory protein
MQDKATISRTSTPSRPTEELPYRVELWVADRTEIVERVLARATSLQLARAIFKAAQSEYPERRITLRKGTRIVADSLA